MKTLSYYTGYLSFLKETERSSENTLAEKEKESFVPIKWCSQTSLAVSVMALFTLAFAKQLFLLR